MRFYLSLTFGNLVIKIRDQQTVSQIMIRQVRWIATRATMLFGLSLLVLTGARAELSDQAKFDLLIETLAQQIATEDYEGCLESVKVLRETGIELPVSIAYFEGLCFYHTEEYELARDRFELYLNEAGRSGRYYDEAIKLYVDAGERAKTGRAKRRKQEEADEARRIKAEAERARRKKAQEAARKKREAEAKKVADAKRKREEAAKAVAAASAAKAKAKKDAARKERERKARAEADLAAADVGDCVNATQAIIKALDNTHVLIKSLYTPQLYLGTLNKSCRGPTTGVRWKSGRGGSGRSLCGKQGDEIRSGLKVCELMYMQKVDSRDHALAVIRATR